MRTTNPTDRRAAATRALVAALMLAAALLTAHGARADDYDPQEAGHPLKVAAYIAAPVGVIFDYVVMRPAHWLVQRQPFRTLFAYDSLTRDERANACSETACRPCPRSR